MSNADSVVNLSMETPRIMDEKSGDVVQEAEDTPAPLLRKLDAAFASVKDEPKLMPIPEVHRTNLNREFELDYANVEVTSLDITSHGCYVLAGCSNGMIMLYDMSANSRYGNVVGHIRAKGMHTNLLVTLRISDDCRYAFAGVMKGSMEMLAVHLGKLPVWKHNQKKKSTPLELVTVHNHLDPKLRGFGAVSPVVHTQLPPNAYLLACGRGIKNIHIWLFCPPTESASASWSCLYDVPSNGNTIETLAFRVSDDHLYVLSKSAGMCLRVWDMSSHKEQEQGETSAKTLAYEDIPNTHDARAFMQSLACGGTYEFAVVNLDAPKWANREVFELPARGTEDDFGQRKRRMMRQIDDVVGTQDGGYIMALCTDGGVMLFTNDYVDTAKKDETSGSPTPPQYGTLCELSASRDPALSSAWDLKRVGKAGEVVLLRAVKSMTAGLNTQVEVVLLSELLADDMMDTSTSKQWSYFGYYYDAVDEDESIADVPTTSSSLLSVPTASSSTAPVPKRSKGPATPAASGSSTPTARASGKHISPDERPPASGTKSISKKQSSAAAGIDTMLSGTTPTVAAASPIVTRKQQQPLRYTEDDDSTDEVVSAAKKRKSVSVAVPSSADVALQRHIQQMESRVVPPYPGNPPTIPSVALSNSTLPKAALPPLLSEYYTLRDHWLQSVEILSNPAHVTSWRAYPMLRDDLSRNLLAEQTRLLVQFYNEVARDMTMSVEQLVHRNVLDPSTWEKVVRGACVGTVDSISTKYQDIVGEVLSRQQMEIQAAQAVSPVPSYSNSPSQPWRFAYPCMLENGRSFASQVQALMMTRPL